MQNMNKRQNDREDVYEIHSDQNGFIIDQTASPLPQGYQSQQPSLVPSQPHRVIKQGNNIN